MQKLGLSASTTANIKPDSAPPAKVSNIEKKLRHRLKIIQSQLSADEKKQERKNKKSLLGQSMLGKRAG